MKIPSVTTSQAISTMPLEKSSKVSVGRRHYGRVCGITPLVYANGGATISVMKTTGQEVVFGRSENTPEEMIQLHYLDFLCYSSLSTFSHQPAFFKATPFTRVSPCSHPGISVYCVCVCVCVCTCVCILVCVCLRLKRGAN